MTDSTKKRILVVEDEQDMRNGLKKVLSRKGYRVDTAEDGVSAMERMQQA